MKTLDEIKQMTAAGDTAQADEALKELLAKEPDNLQAKMLYGTCRQLLGDEETFKRIHDELAPVIGKQALPNTALWKAFDSLFNVVGKYDLTFHHAERVHGNRMLYIGIAAVILVLVSR